MVKYHMVSLFLGEVSRCWISCKGGGGGTDGNGPATRRAGGGVGLAAGGAWHGADVLMR